MEYFICLSGKSTLAFLTLKPGEVLVWHESDVRQLQINVYDVVYIGVFHSSAVHMK